MNIKILSSGLRYTAKYNTAPSLNVGEELRLNTGTKDLNTVMDSRIQSVGLSHLSSVCVVM